MDSILTIACKFGYSKLQSHPSLRKPYRINDSDSSFKTSRRGSNRVNNGPLMNAAHLFHCFVKKRCLSSISRAAIPVVVPTGVNLGPPGTHFKPFQTVHRTWASFLLAPQGSKPKLGLRCHCHSCQLLEIMSEAPEPQLRIDIRGKGCHYFPSVADLPNNRLHPPGGKVTIPGLWHWHKGSAPTRSGRAAIHSFKLQG